MKAVIQLTPDGAGRLHIYPGDDTEAYALKCWHNQYVGGGNSELQVHEITYEEAHGNQC